MYKITVHLIPEKSHHPEVGFYTFRRNGKEKKVAALKVIFMAFDPEKELAGLDFSQIRKVTCSAPC